MDLERRQLAREIRQTWGSGIGDISVAGRFLASMHRSNEISTQLLSLLAMARFEPAIQIVGPQPPLPLHFQMGFTFGHEPDDAAVTDIQEENNRIIFLRTIPERFTLFRICLGLLRHTFQQIITKREASLQHLFRVNRPTSAWNKALARSGVPADLYQPPVHSQNLSAFLTTVTESLAFLDNINPPNVPDQRKVNSYIKFYRTWSMNASLEGTLFGEVRESPKKTERMDWTCVQALYNLLEGIRHVFLTLAGRDTDTDPCSGPFLLDTLFGGDHGGLNPHCHYAEFYAGLLRIEEFSGPEGIDWYIIISNIVMACYFSYGALALDDLQLHSSQEAQLEREEAQLRKLIQTRSSRENQLDTQIPEIINRLAAIDTESNFLETEIHELEDELDNAGVESENNPEYQALSNQNEALGNEQTDLLAQQQEFYQQNSRWRKLTSQIDVIEARVEMLQNKNSNTLKEEFNSLFLQDLLGPAIISVTMQQLAGH